jgi:hypothetical protein
MDDSTISPRTPLAADTFEHEHDGCCAGQLTFGPDRRLVLSVVCDHCGATVTVLGSLDYHLAAKPGPAIDLAA